MSGLRSALKDWGLALAIIIAVLGAWSFMHRGALSEGPAPAVILHGPRGDVELAQLQGQVVVLNFWATWCGPCIEEIPEVQAFHTANPQIPLYAVSIDQGSSRQQVEATSQRRGGSFPVVMDDEGDVARAFRIDGVPTTVVIDASGQIASTHVGFLSSEALEELVQAASHK